ncbi:non-canonical purine NTP pyrophosphatase [Alicyclobacillus sacchari]|nr:non-canonical purine NTP pyrophosphatase [Alicyclobacillus sacchari]GMA55934.1 non-canonical purine NTP pyrophosphatase [Alicyclobacillus sacchari]
MKLFIATKNAHKVEEFRLLLAGVPVDLLPLPVQLPEAPETSTTFLDIAREKALFYARELDAVVLADDSGLVVPKLHGEPGIYSARYSGKHGDDEANNEKLIARLHENGLSCAEAYFTCAVAIANVDGIIGAVEGRVTGTVYDFARGARGFGYDPLFAPVGEVRRFAEMSMEEKAAYSHRAKAVELARPILISIAGSTKLS